MPSLTYPDKRVAAERYILSLNPMLYAPLWRRDGVVIPSEDAYGRLCTVTGALWTPQGRSFDGVDDQIVVPDTASLDFTSATILVWTKPTSFTGQPVFIGKGGYGAGWYFQFDTDGSFWPYSKLAVGEVGSGDTASVTNCVAGTWYQLGWSYGGGNAITYVNGVAETTFVSASTMAINATDIIIGTYTDGTLDYAGVISEVLICNRALNVAEIQHIYHLTRWRYQ